MLNCLIAAPEGLDSLLRLISFISWVGCCQHGGEIFRDEGDVGREREVEQYQGVTKQVLRGVEFGRLPLCACVRGAGEGGQWREAAGQSSTSVCRDLCSCVQTLWPNTAEEEGEGGWRRVKESEEEEDVACFCWINVAIKKGAMFCLKGECVRVCVTWRVWVWDFSPELWDKEKLSSISVFCVEVMCHSGFLHTMSFLLLFPLFNHFFFSLLSGSGSLTLILSSSCLFITPQLCSRLDPSRKRYHCGTSPCSSQVLVTVFCISPSVCACVRVHRNIWHSSSFCPAEWDYVSSWYLAENEK